MSRARSRKDDAHLLLPRNEEAASTVWLTYLLSRLWHDQEAVLRFVENFAVPFDNNSTERDVRMVKVQQKVSGCFRSQQGVSAFARIRDHLSTLRKQGWAALTALQQIMLGHPVLPSFDVAE